jgi:hypothetical protein
MWFLTAFTVGVGMGIGFRLSWLVMLFFESRVKNEIHEIRKG